MIIVIVVDCYGLVQKAVNALSQLEQCPQPRSAEKVAAALKPLANALVGGGLLQHADKDVRLLVAICVAELFRVNAPEPPFEAEHLKVVLVMLK